jgi:transposase
MAKSMVDGETAAYRIIYRIFNGDLEDADWVYHTCGNIECVEPTHLKLKKRNDDGPEYFARRWQEAKDAGVREGGCLLWKQSVDKNGYGCIKVDGDTWLIHRFAFQMANQLEEIPQGKQVCHCHSGNRNCFDDLHLRLGTAEENGQDRVDHGTSNVGERNHAALLTDEQALQVFELYSSTTSAAAVAQQFGVSVAVVKGIWFHGSYSSATGQTEARTARREGERAKRKEAREAFGDEIAPEQYDDAVRRIMAKVTVDPVRGCWIVGGAANPYPSISIAGRFRHCHRVILESAKNGKKQLPDDIVARHLCEERGYEHHRCANPDHLAAGTSSENAIDHVLTDHETVRAVKRIKRDIAKGMKPKDVADKHGKSLTSIYKIRDKVHYSYLSPAKDDDTDDDDEKNHPLAHDGKDDDE